MDIDSLSDLFVHPHPTSPGSTAQRVNFGMFHLFEDQGIHGFQDFSWRLVDSAVASKITGIMVSQSFVQRMAELEASVPDGLLQEFGMVDNVTTESELRILDLKSVVTMGAGGEYLFDVVALKCFDVGLSQNLVQVFVAYTAGRVATASFFHP